MEAATQTVCVAAKTASHQPRQVQWLRYHPHHPHHHQAISILAADVFLSGTRRPSRVDALTPGRLSAALHRRPFVRLNMFLSSPAPLESAFFLLLQHCYAGSIRIGAERGGWRGAQGRHISSVLDASELTAETSGGGISPVCLLSESCQSVARRTSAGC